jgi:hypothetical protein
MYQKQLPSMKANLTILMLLMSVSVFGQDSLRVFTGELSTRNRNKLKIIGPDTYVLNVAEISKKVSEFQLYYFENSKSIFDSLKFKIKDDILNEALILDYYIDADLFYVLARKKILVYSISKKEVIEKYELKKNMNVIHQIDNHRIYLSLTHLYHPLDEPHSLSIGYINKQTKEHRVLNLTEYESLVLLGASVRTITKSKDYFYVSHLNSYKIDVYNNELEKLSSFEEPSAFKTFNAYAYSEEQLYEDVSWFHEIVENGDYQHPRMLGIQAIQDDTLIVVYKLPTVKETPRPDYKIMLDLWIKNDQQQWRKSFAATVKDDTFPYGVNKAIFLHFKGDFMQANRFSTLKLKCANPKDKICTIFHNYLYPNCEIHWHPVVE